MVAKVVQINKTLTILINNTLMDQMGKRKDIVILRQMMEKSITLLKDHKKNLKSFLKNNKKSLRNILNSLLHKENNKTSLIAIISLNKKRNMKKDSEKNKLPKILKALLKSFSRIINKMYF